jgi:hypothetical protein
MAPARVVAVTGANGLRGSIETTTWPRDGSQPEVLVQLDDGRQVLVPLGGLHRQEDGRDALRLDPAALEARQGTAVMSAGAPSWSPSYMMIVSLLEEVSVIETQLMLREELRITRRHVEAHRPVWVTLRRKEATVELSMSSRASSIIQHRSQEKHHGQDSDWTL